MTSAKLPPIMTGLRPMRSDRAPKSGNATMWAISTDAVTAKIGSTPRSVSSSR